MTRGEERIAPSQRDVICDANADATDASADHRRDSLTTTCSSTRPVAFLTLEKHHADSSPSNLDLSLALRRRKQRHRKSMYTLAISSLLYFILLLIPDSKEKSSSSRHLSKNPDRHFHSATINHDFAPYSCESLNDLTTVHGPLSDESKCDFARTCNDGDGIFAPIVFCHPTLSTRTLMLLLSPPLILFLTVLFRILGSTAEEFFSPGLEMFSLKLGLPERFAGVTLLALGNGAPDVASTVNAILEDRKRGYLMALGELTGAAMVASTLIVGAVVHIAGGVVCRGAMVRDVVVFILTMAVVYKSFEDGSITVDEIKWFIGIYLVYVVLVLGSDLYHKLVYVPRATLLKQTKERTNTHEMEGGPTDGNIIEAPQAELTKYEVSETLPLLEKPKCVERRYTEPVLSSEKKISDSVGTSSTVPAQHIAPPRQKPMEKIERMIEFISNYDADSSGSTASGEEESSADIEASAPPSKSFHSQDVSEKHHTVKKQHSADGWGVRDSKGSEPLMVFHPHHGGLIDLKHAASFDHEKNRHHHHHDLRRISIPISPTAEMHAGSGTILKAECRACIEGEPGRSPDGWIDAFRSSGQELVEYWCKMWGETYASDEYGAVEKFLITCEMPFTVLRMLSIPVPCDGYYCRPLVAVSIAVSPLWMWFYCYNQFGIDLMNGSAISVVLITVVPVVFALLILRYSPCGEVPMRVSAAVPITIVGFAASAAWLDLIADKLVSLLSFFGIMLHIPATIMGLTILAWGNSSQDLIANTTVAKKGLSTMAITASFAGPVFNILIGLGIGLAILTQQSHRPGDPVPVYLNNPLRVGFAFSILNGVLVIIGGIFVGKGMIPKSYGYVAMALYTAYVIASLTL